MSSRCSASPDSDALKRENQSKDEIVNQTEEVDAWREEKVSCSRCEAAERCQKGKENDSDEASKEKLVGK